MERGDLVGLRWLRIDPRRSVAILADICGGKERLRSLLDEEVEKEECCVKQVDLEQRLKRNNRLTYECKYLIVTWGKCHNS